VHPGSIEDARSDQSLVADLNAGDSSAFDGIYYRYRDWVYRLTFRLTGNQEDALDVLQETFGYFFGKFPGFVLSARITTFLFPAVKNLSIAHRRKRLRAQGEELTADFAANTDPVHPDQARSELATVLVAIPETHREVLLMRFVDDMNLAEIGQALGIPEGTVKSRLHNAIATLRQDPRVKKYFEQ
jgi:RNA polymerase sigma-70 factor (ECF subfamily)